jgi:hypothetical protein
MKTDDPPWVYEKPHPHGALVRYTPRTGVFRDADWVEPRGWSSDPRQDKTYTLVCSGSVRVANSTFTIIFEDKEYYTRWIPNPERRVRLLEILGVRLRHKYWMPDL